MMPWITSRLVIEDTMLLNIEKHADDALDVVVDF